MSDKDLEPRHLETLDRDLGNGLVFDLAQLLGIDLFISKLRAGLQQILRTQETTDVVGTKNLGGS